MRRRPPTLITGGLGKRRSLESRAGKLARMARMLRRKGYAKESGEFAKASALERMNTPAVRSQDYRFMEEQKQKDLLELQAARRARTIDFLNRSRPYNPPTFGGQPESDPTGGMWRGPHIIKF